MLTAQTIPPDSAAQTDRHTTFAPTLVTEVDLREPLPELAAREGGKAYRGAWVLVRLDSEPIGVVRLAYDDRNTRDVLADAIATQLGPVLTARLGSDRDLLGMQLLSGVPATAREGGYLRELAAALRDGPTFSVIVCTRDRARVLGPCLAALQRLRYSRFEVVVVDNTAGDAAVETLVRRIDSPVPFRYVVERNTGLARARNRGTQASEGDVVAFIDDDAIADTHWLAELARGYLGVEGAGSVNGSIMPAELNTQAQNWFAEYGGHSKGRGFVQEIFDPSQPNAQSPLYPLPPFGAGGNMSFRRELLAHTGGFDHALGAGTPAQGAEETAMFTHLLLAGHRIVYRPSALVWHRDREDFDDLRRQLQALGTSLTAYYTALLWSNPRLVLPLVRLLPRGLRDLRGKDGSVRAASFQEDFPAALLRAHRRGMISGPWAYVRGRSADRRAQR